MSTVAIAVACGIAIGLCLGALGGGGSILAVPMLVSLLHVHPQSATSASLIIVGVTAVIAAVAHARVGHVRWKAAIAFGVIASITAFGGSILNRAVDPQVLLIAFSALMAVAAAAMLRGTWKTAERKPDQVTVLVPTPAAEENSSPAGVATLVRSPVGAAKAVCTFVASALVVGFLTGFLGVGGGFLIVPALVLAMSFSMPVAIGTSLVVISITCAGAFVERLGTAIPWPIVAPFTAAAIVGSFAGAAISHRISGNALTRSFAAVIIAIAIYVAAIAGFNLAQ